MTTAGRQRRTSAALDTLDTPPSAPGGMRGEESHCEQLSESKVSDRERLGSTESDLVVCPLSGLVFLQLLLPLPQLALRVADVAAQAVAVEVVVAAGLSERLPLLDKNQPHMKTSAYFII